MEKSGNQIAEEEFNIRCGISNIKWFVRDHALTAKQLSDIFREGIAACVKNGTLHLPSFSEDELPDVPVV